MSTEPSETVIPLTIPPWMAERLSVLIDPDQGLPDLAAVIYELLDHVQQGIYRPGAWEHEWIKQVFGDAWLERMEPDDRPEMLSADGRIIFQRPRIRAPARSAAMADTGSRAVRSAWAVISPAGELAWYPLGSQHEVEALVGGPVAPGALDTATVTLTGIPPGRGPLKVLASDIALVYPGQYELNPVAGRVLCALSGGRLDQQWRGTVALVEYERDQVSGEVLWPGEMCPEWVEAVSTAVRRAQDAR